ncbi:phosphotransferase [Streptomyces griseorubiginosus]|uniref:phosphotransferase n=1 Tax=Streptomyces griseorubiginosus TaxID=67304 RepID=UPI001AD6E820|nr:phosphotransferase [Streptomyces griseorubiginosus]MBO4260246.1 phosphotransferase [Streptomyces griseorubiginosus]
MNLLPPTPAQPLPTLSDLLGPALPGLLTSCERHVGPITATERVHGGNISHVFRVRGTHTDVIVKIRGDRYARMPTLRTDPTVIDDERRALKVYGRIAPAVFPQVLGFHAEAHAMILSDVFPSGRNYHDHLTEHPATATEMTLLGRTLRRIHHATQDTDTTFRSRSNQWFQERSFLFCLRATGHDLLEQTCEELTALPRQQLVLGDLAPKNLHLTASSVAICDLDNVHAGWPPYDTAYFLAHLLIHHLGRPAHLRTLVPALLTAYFAAPPPLHLTATEELLMAKVAAGVVLYRLDETVPYPLPSPTAVADRYRTRVLRLLGTRAFTVHDLVQAAGTAQEEAA